MDLKSSARKIAESKEMVEACKDERKEKGKKAAEEVVEVVDPDVAVALIGGSGGCSSAWKRSEETCGNCRVGTSRKTD